MHESIQEVPERIISLAKVALMQANTHAAFHDFNNEDTDKISILNAAHAGELLLKAIIAREHPLLIFRNLFDVASDLEAEFDVTTLLNRGQTHDYSKLPNVLWACCQLSVPNLELYRKIGKLRNQIQHFIAPYDSEYRNLSLQFIYECIDPLLRENFDMNAVECHEDEMEDHLIHVLIEREIVFYPPAELNISEFDLAELVSSKPEQYQNSLRANFDAASQSRLLAS